MEFTKVRWKRIWKISAGNFLLSLVQGFLQSKNTSGEIRALVSHRWVDGGKICLKP